MSAASPLPASIYCKIVVLPDHMHIGKTKFRDPCQFRKTDFVARQGLSWLSTEPRYLDRHQVRRETIEDGETKVVEKETYHPKTIGSALFEEISGKGL
jgi:hypothetical protein